jgi:sporulation protein YlmC with PRC-barrel domain
MEEQILKVKEIINKKVIDSSGNEVGEVKDLEIDWSSKTVIAIIIDKESAIKKEVSGKLLSTLRIRDDEPDIPVPVKEIAAVGKFVILSKSIG